jgi:hypothetical protein
MDYIRRLEDMRILSLHPKALLLCSFCIVELPTSFAGIEGR